MKKEFNEAEFLSIKRLNDKGVKVEDIAERLSTSVDDIKSVLLKNTTTVYKMPDKLRRGLYKDKIVSLIMKKDGSAYVYDGFKPLKENGKAIELDRIAVIRAKEAYWEKHSEDYLQEQTDKETIKSATAPLKKEIKTEIKPEIIEEPNLSKREKANIAVFDKQSENESNTEEYLLKKQKELYNDGIEHMYYWTNTSIRWKNKEEFSNSILKEIKPKLVLKIFYGGIICVFTSKDKLKYKDKEIFLNENSELAIWGARAYCVQQEAANLMVGIKASLTASKESIKISNASSIESFTD